ncbi:DUF6456 domain-containing protein [Mesorhizobium yinganensis]|uniref:DUF6456 domain-containing protein n=1 Tax=Mesorhizobium yinganensis TaxID=3157707 RepID=UPI0032B78578
MNSRDMMGKAAARVLALLAGGPAKVEAAADSGVVLLRSEKGTISIEANVLRRMASSGSIVRRGNTLQATEAGRKAELRAGETGDCFQRQHRDTEIASASSDDGVIGSAEINLAESPLAQLMRLRVKSGRAFLSKVEFAAGERLRCDYTRGRIMQRLGANWEASPSSGRRGDVNGIADLTDAALAARQRVDRALQAVGPELSGLLVDICCFLKGLETVERERLWPARSAKMLLKTALGMLARHYHPAGSGRGHVVLHWGAEGYRPENMM